MPQRIPSKTIKKIKMPKKTSEDNAVKKIPSIAFP
jgi:hypothetical protein